MDLPTFTASALAAITVGDIVMSMRRSAFALALVAFAFGRAALAQASTDADVPIREAATDSAATLPPVAIVPTLPRPQPAVLGSQWYAPPAAIDPAYRAPPRLAVDGDRARRMVAGGAVLFGIPYVVTVVAAIVSLSSGPRGVGLTSAGLAFVPVFGPFADAGLLDPRLGYGALLYGMLFVVDGVIQMGGLGLMVPGLVGMSRAARQRPRNNSTWTITPGAPGVAVGATITLVTF